jgi:gamma-glutamyltranspeptidase/glutathione hydrolase
MRLLGRRANRLSLRIFTFLIVSFSGYAYSAKFAGIVSSATPEASRIGADVLRDGGNAIDAAVATSLALTVSEPAGSGIGGQTVMLVKLANQPPFVIHGTTWSPRTIPDGVEKNQLRLGRTASTVPSTLKVLSLAHEQFGSQQLSWSRLVLPAAKLARNGVSIGSFRHLSFRNYSEDLSAQQEAAEIFLKRDGSIYQIGDTLKQPKLAKTLERIAKVGAEDFYSGRIAREIARDMERNGGWIRLEDLTEFPEPKIIEPLSIDYRGHEISTLPPPFGGWVVLQALRLLEAQVEAESESLLADNGSQRRAALIKALSIAHQQRRTNPVPSFIDYDEDVQSKISTATAEQLLADFNNKTRLLLENPETGGETTHFTVADAEGNVVSVTQSIDSYFGAKVVHPKLGFLYNNYMQSFRLEDDGSPFVLKEKEMPLSSMSATIVSRNGNPVLALGSPGSARIISAVVQVTSYWLDVEPNIEAAVAAFRVHALPPKRAYVEGPIVTNQLLTSLGAMDLDLIRPVFGVSDNHLDPYFGGVHGLAVEDGRWQGAADPRRDGLVVFAYLRD